MVRTTDHLKTHLAVWCTVFLVVTGLAGWLGAAFGVLPAWAAAGIDWLSRFAVVFMGIVVEAVPFLLLGTLASGVVEVFVTPQSLYRWLPGGALGSALTGSLVGMFFPVCECGIVPFTRRLLRKGAPLPMVVAALMAAPVINPIVIASTLAAFGPGPILWGRLAGTLVIAVTVGLVFSLHKNPRDLLVGSPARPGEAGALEEDGDFAVSAENRPTGFSFRVRRVMVTAVDEFFEMGRFLILGAALAALMQTLVRQPALLQVGQGPLLSVVVMLALAVLLSVCSTVDAFIALAFAGTFTSGSILAFLVYGPMVDIKSTLMFLRVFRPRIVAVLVLLPLLLTLVMAVFLNYFWTG